MWRDISSAPVRKRVLVCGGEIGDRPVIASDIPGMCSPVPPPDGTQEWYRETSRGTGSIWPHPTHWMEIPRAYSEGET